MNTTVLYVDGNYTKMATTTHRCQLLDKDGKYQTNMDSAVLDMDGNY